jgi:hypothetical protein
MATKSGSQRPEFERWARGNRCPPDPLSLITGATGWGKRSASSLETLTHAYPVRLNKEEVAARAGYEANGGGFNNALGRLRTLELVQGRAELKASDNLFDSGSM